MAGETYSVRGTSKVYNCAVGWCTIVGQVSWAGHIPTLSVSLVNTILPNRTEFSASGCRGDGPNSLDNLTPIGPDRERMIRQASALLPFLLRLISSAESHTYRAGSVTVVGIGFSAGTPTAQKRRAHQSRCAAFPTRGGGERMLSYYGKADNGVGYWITTGRGSEGARMQWRAHLRCGWAGALRCGARSCWQGPPAAWGWHLSGQSYRLPEPAVSHVTSSD